MLRKSRLFLIEIDSNQFKRDRRTFLQAHQNIQHGKAVFTAR
ncbi:Uncharacterised protein [Vibrio cholerae]|nr:Uncharacterised protein [Vibrio cholerae]CSC24102.1 Uncharacterised protein [Vibrio cholerae]CSD21032.1 Uncharacterised protein [Vibrio cholerae]